MKHNYQFEKKYTSGQILIEPILAIGIFSLILTPFLGSLSNIIISDVKYRHRAEAAHFAREGLEVAYNISINSDWDEFAAPFTDEEISLKDNNSSPPNLEEGNQTAGRYTREIIIRQARRNPDGNLDEEGGAPDPNTLRVLSRVSWDERNHPQEVEYALYLINPES